jgi:hypothetical protein
VPDGSRPVSRLMAGARRAKIHFLGHPVDGFPQSTATADIGIYRLLRELRESSSQIGRLHAEELVKQPGSFHRFETCSGGYAPISTTFPQAPRQNTARRLHHGRIGRKNARPWTTVPPTPLLFVPDRDPSLRADLLEFARSSGGRRDTRAGRSAATCHPARLEALDPMIADFLARAELEIEARLPWRSASTGEPVAMNVVESGVLSEEHAVHPRGTPYITIAVDSWEAADAAREALAPIAGLDDHSWVLDWEMDPGRYRKIRIFPPAELAEHLR